MLTSDDPVPGHYYRGMSSWERTVWLLVSGFKGFRVEEFRVEGF